MHLPLTVPRVCAAKDIWLISGPGEVFAEKYKKKSKLSTAVTRGRDALCRQRNNNNTYNEITLRCK